ncbi:MAG: TonB-dependent receptor [Tannerellaceae bacterium]|jgi:TonB-linked SusC/RagA family outer membrane protein|nr:TonB-dependent receptor [Tannerellaceae bacterium]
MNENNSQKRVEYPLCKGIQKTFFLMLFALLGTWSILAQERAISGSVVDSNGEALIGVTIVVKGATIGTITDENGRFSLSNVSSNAVLVISYVGYVTQEVPVASKTDIHVTMLEDTKTLDEVVVVGYGTQKRSDITGSVTTVPKDRLAKIPVNNVMQAIQGAAAGVNVSQSSSVPGDTPSTIVRGRNSVNASSEPYIVVDGIPLSKKDMSINDINPNDIESVEILKDPSAVAIYGTNGSSGVILITTKRGKTGKPTIRYSGYGGVEQLAHILEPNTPDVLLDQYAEYARINNLPLNPDYAPARYQNEVDNYKNGTVTDWIDAVTQTGIVQDHNISAMGGTDNVQYYMSGDFLDQKGVVKGYNYKRYSFRTNIDLKATDFLSMGASTFVAFHNRDGGRANLLNAAAMSPYGKMYDENGDLERYPIYSETLWQNPLLPTTVNPARRETTVSVNGYGEVDFGKIYSPLGGLKFKINAGFSYVPKRSTYYEGESVYRSGGWGQINNDETQSYTIENIVTYSKDLGKNHFDLTGLYSTYNKTWRWSRAEATQFPNDLLGANNLGLGATMIAGSNANQRRLLSQMGRLNYNYDSRYLFTFTVRRDGSSVFGENYKWGTFPSLAFGWNVTRETFAQPWTSVLNNLKLRASWGYSGNENINEYASLFLMNNDKTSMDKVSQTTLKVRPDMGNANLQWERTEGLNLAADFGLWNNRLNGTIEWYTRTTDGVLLWQNLPQLSGYTRVMTNIGTLNNKGVEITLNSTNIDVKDFRWGTTLVFARNKQQWIDVYGGKTEDVGNRWFIGQPIGVIYDYTKVGIWQEDEIAAGKHLNWQEDAEAGAVKLADLSGPDGTPDGKIDDYDRSILGQTDPKWTGGITNTFTYKNLTLSIFINTVQGQMRNNGIIGTASDEQGRRNGYKDIGYWTPENKSNEWRSLSNNSNRKGYGFPMDASFTRIKDITISYNIPDKLVTKLKLDAVQIYASGRNLYTFTDWIGWDPEARYIGRGSENWEVNYPVTRSFVFGLNVTF